MKALYQAYASTMRKIGDINGAINVLQWDKEVNLPPKGAKTRSRQVATLAGMAHEIVLDKSFRTTLTKLYEGRDQLAKNEAKNVELTFKDLQKKERLPTEFVIRRSKVTANTYHAWLRARKANDYDLYKSALGTLVELKKEQANLIGFEAHPYDALMDEYESNATVKALDLLFEDVREKLVAFVQKIKTQPQVDNSFLKRFYDKDKQWNFGIKLLKNMGYDFEAGRQDISPHPFTTNFSPTDVRITTRIDEQDFGNMTWSCIHEGGHALYEQGLPIEYFGFPLGSYISLSIHESQSRLWENNVARSLDYWTAHYGDLQQLFPENLANISLIDFYKGINCITSNPIRTEADELNYHFHVLIRYEIEKGLVEGSLSVDNLDKVWNEKYKSYLGIDIQHDNEGVLQDIHWAHGSMGYFPTYSLGSFYAAQFMTQIQKDIPNLLELFRLGQHQQLLAWLRENIHQHGRRYSAEELCVKITGEPLNFKYFMDYAEQKYRFIYNLNNI